MHPVQRAFHEEHGLQCGFCTPGMVMAAVSLLAENPDPTEEEVRTGLEGNLCRCTGYHNIVRAVLAAAETSGGGLVIPAPFTYQRAGTVDEALDLAAEHGEDAKFLAGGHSLLPLMKLRLAVPEVLIDMGGLRELTYIRDEGGHIAIGALTRHHDLEQSALLARSCRCSRTPPGRSATRRSGTGARSAGRWRTATPPPTCPPWSWPWTRRWSPAGRRAREIARGVLQGLFETALEPGELLTEIRVPKPAQRGWSFQKFTKRAIDWAIVGVAVQGGQVALVNMGGTPMRAAAVERPWPAARRPPTRRRTPPRAPARPPTSTPAAPTGSTWPGSWSPAPSPRQVQGHSAERAVVPAVIKAG